MTDARTFIIVGASLAGAKAAQTLRDEGFTGRVILLGDEPVRPYERPPLSKEYLQGKAGLDAVFVHDEDYYEKHDIDLRLSTHVQALDVKNREVVLGLRRAPLLRRRFLTTEGAPAHDRTGIRFRGHPVSAYRGRFRRLRSAIRAANRVVVIGAGWIGCEVAAPARLLGAEVAVVEVANLAPRARARARAGRALPGRPR